MAEDKLAGVGKPLGGLWYSINTSWMEWCLAEQPDWLSQYIYEIEIARLVMPPLHKLSSDAKFEKFETEFALSDNKFRMKLIDWLKVAEQYDGLEINPYNTFRRLGSFWYYGWDCASGVIWRGRAIKSIKLFAIYDKDKNVFDDDPEYFLSKSNRSRRRKVIL